MLRKITLPFPPPMKSIREVLKSGSQYLEERGIDEARHNMQSLIAHVLQCDKTWLYLHFEDPIAADKLPQLRDMLRQRAQGIPLQHLLGSVEFYRREFRSDARALIPRPETEELVELALERFRKLRPQPIQAKCTQAKCTQDDVPQQKLRILDMGTGSGIIGISLALELAEMQPEVTLIDISPAALSLALENATQLGACVKTYQSDLFSIWNESEEKNNAVIPPSGYHLALANLPYIPEGEALSLEVHHDPASALYGGEDGLDIIRRFLSDALPHLASQALVLLEVGHDQGEATRAIMEELGYTHSELCCDISGIARFPLARAPFKQAKMEEKAKEEQAGADSQSPASD